MIEYGEFERVGGNKTLKCDVRLVAATNEDLPERARAGAFRFDLLDRLAFDVITLPPLRAREEDILLLAEHFAITMAGELGRDLFAGFTPTVRDALLAHRWPGNVRELKNVVERCVYRTPEEQPVEEIVFDPFDSPFRPSSEPTGNAAGRDNGAPSRSAPSLPLDLKEAVQGFEIDLLELALQQGRHNQRKAAELLGLTYHQLRGYLKKYELLKKD